MKKSWNPKVKILSKMISKEDYEFLVAEVAEIIYNQFSQRHQTKQPSTAPEPYKTFLDVGRTGTDG